MLELEAFLKYPYEIKQAIEHKVSCTGAMSMQLLYDLKILCESVEATLDVLLHPRSVSLKDRERETETRNRFCEAVEFARQIMAEELHARKFVARPSNARLVQCYMSKGYAASLYLTENQLQSARSFYLQWLRKAAVIANKTKVAATATQTTKKGGLFRGGIALQAKSAAAEPPLMIAGPSASDAPAAAAPSAAAPQVASEDVVTEEVNRWLAISQSKINEYVDEEGMLNEFALVYSLKDEFPLHYIVFKQVCAHSHNSTITP